MSWREYDMGRQLLKETGPRAFLSLSGENRVSPHWVYGVQGRFYIGTLNYDGETLDTPPQPVRTDTDYDGWSAEVDFTHYFAPWAGKTTGRGWGANLGLGLDNWKRMIRNTGTVSGYEERYLIGYGRLGAVYAGNGWSTRGGVKVPLATREEVGWSKFGFNNPVLSPGPKISLYLSASWFFNGSWSLVGYYDGYRFAKSRAENLVVNGTGTIAGGVYQPKSEQDRFGVAVGYHF